MLKVICIDDRDEFGFNSSQSVVIGHIYTVTGNVGGIGTDGSVEPCYFLAEFTRDDCFLCRFFAPLSSINETQMERNYNKVKELL